MSKIKIYSLYFEVDSKLKLLDECQNTSLETIMEFSTRFNNEKAMLKYLKNYFKLKYINKASLYIYYRKRRRKRWLFKQDKALLNINMRRYLARLTRHNLIYNDDFRAHLSHQLGNSPYYQTEIRVINHEIKQMPIHTENLELYSNQLIYKIFKDYHLTFSIIDIYYFIKEYQKHSLFLDLVPTLDEKSFSDDFKLLFHQQEVQEVEQLVLFKEFLEENAKATNKNKHFK